MSLSLASRILFTVPCVVATSFLASAAEPSSPARPNVLWIMCEDTSAEELGCYGNTYAITPNIDRLARQGVRYNNAFCTAPVCSPSRCCQLTGVYATSLCTQNLRSAFPIPASIKGFPTYLRQAGYYTTNNVKTDYNTANAGALIVQSWNACSAEADWRRRKPGQPFLAVFTIFDTHQSHRSVNSFEAFEKEIGSKLTAAERHDPAKALLPPYYPDTPLARRSVARSYDCVTSTDKGVGCLVRQLEEDGLADDTIIMIGADHGAGMPRGKRTLYNFGLRTPLVIRFPKHFQHLAPVAPGQATDQIVSYVDIPPTLLRLAGLPIPAYMQGQVFLGPAAGAPAGGSRQNAFGARDRVDEAFEVSRSVHDGHWLYVRNYMPHLSWMQPEGYSDQALMRREMFQLAAQEKLNAAQMTFAAPTKPLEELFDSAADPHNIHNLAAAPEHRAVLERMRKQVHEWILATRDVGFLPEPDVVAVTGGKAAYDWARQPGAYPLERVLAAADLVGRPESLQQQIALLGDSDRGVRYWAAVGLTAQGSRAATARPALLKALDDSSASVRIEAAGILAALGDCDRPLKVLVAELQGDDGFAATRAARTLQLLGAKARPVAAEMRAMFARGRKPPKGGDGGHVFALHAALGKLDQPKPKKPATKTP